MFPYACIKLNLRLASYNSVLRHVVLAQMQDLASADGFVDYKNAVKYIIEKFIVTTQSLKQILCTGQFANFYHLVNVLLQIWCWSCHNGAALLKMSAFPKEQDDSASQMQKAFLDGSVIAILSTTLCLVWTLLLFFHICYIFKIARIRKQVIALKRVFCSGMGLSLWPNSIG